MTITDKRTNSTITVTRGSLEQYMSVCECKPEWCVHMCMKVLRIESKRERAREREREREGERERVRRNYVPSKI